MKQKAGKPTKPAKSAKPSGFQSELVKAREVQGTLYMLRTIVDSAVIRLHLTYPSVSQQDWLHLLTAEGIVRANQNERLPIDNALALELVKEDAERQARGVPGMFSTGLICKDVDRAHQIFQCIAEFVDAFEKVFSSETENETARGKVLDDAVLALNNGSFQDRICLLSLYKDLKKLTGDLNLNFLEERTDECLEEYS